MSSGNENGNGNGNPSSGTNDRSPRPASGQADASSSAENGTPGRDRPLAVYGVLALGVVTLLVLLAIIYFSSGDRDKPEQPICTAITADQTMQRVYAGEVERLTVNYDDAGDPQTGERYGPVQAQVDFTNGQCAYLPQGVTGMDAIYKVLGAIEFFNDTTEFSRVDVNTQRAENLPESLYWTPTPPATETPLPTEPPVLTPTPSPTVTPTETPVAVTSPTAVTAASPEVEGTPAIEASPAA